jgi:hypothetical protein
MRRALPDLLVMAAKSVLVTASALALLAALGMLH